VTESGENRRRLAGARALLRALEAGEAVRLVLVRRGADSPALRRALASARAQGVPIRTAGPREVERFAAAGEDRDLLALVGPDPARDLADALRAGGAVWLLVRAAYPGNAGFAIRSAEVSGADAAVVDAAFDRPARQRALRASMRADRWMPVFFAEAQAVLADAQAAGKRLIAIEDSGRRAPWEVDLRGSALFAVGGEQSGLPAPVLDACDAVVRVPMAGFIPSYNLQAAMAVVMGERLRQQAAAAPAPPVR
jgi:tRNA G18 (ribose-2'-O)-methylase SpoU